MAGDKNAFGRLKELARQSQAIADSLNAKESPNDIEEALTEAVWCIGRHAEFAKS
jgi:hypothetical protein